MCGGLEVADGCRLCVWWQEGEGCLAGGRVCGGRSGQAAVTAGSR